MKTSNILHALGFSLIILGVSIEFIPSRELPQAETKPISQERSCLIEAVWHEARNTSMKERQMVLQVILNRVKHKDYPDTICGVVQQPFQFSYRNNFKQNSSIIPEFQSMNDADKRAYLEIEQLVDRKLNSGASKGVHSKVLFFHTKFVQPIWSKDKKNKRISLDKRFLHVYYSAI